VIARPAAAGRQRARWVGVVLAMWLAAGCGRGDGLANAARVAAGPDTAANATSTVAGTSSSPGTDATATTVAATAATAPATTMPPATTVAPVATAAPTSTPPAPPTTAAEAPVAATEVRNGPDGFRFESRGIDAALRARMEPTSWRPGCPVGLEDLRYLRLSHRDFGGGVRTGELVVHADAVDAMFEVFSALWVARYPIASMQLVDDFGGSDDASVAADNTSAFNCRFVAGTTRWSNHATGRAIDINPIENPWVAGGVVDNAASLPFVERRPAPGVIIEGDAVVRAFDAVGWGWGGRWGEPLDYQHFSSTGS